MADFDNLEIDPAIVEAMGFSGFGTQPGKKRKFNADDGFIDPDMAKSSSAKGANSVPLGTRISDATISPTPVKVANIASQPGTPAPKTASVNHIKPHEVSLEALRHGVPNEQGDVVYFLPSFLEDPWANFRSRK